MDKERLTKLLQFIMLFIAALGGALGGIPLPQVTLPGGRTQPTQQTQPPATQPPATQPPAQPPANAKAAIGRIQFGNAGCTATIIEPVLPDGRYQVLTAAHCVRGQPRVGKMSLESGEVFAIEVQRIDATSDCCWCVTVEPQRGLPVARLATSLPQRGDKVFHCGYGVHLPRNVEYGTVVNPSNEDGQTEFDLSVSSGDSGGGIALNDRQEIVSTVCCTSALSKRGSMWGASVDSIKKIRPTSSKVSFEWSPVDIPTRKGSPVSDHDCDR